VIIFLFKNSDIMSNMTSSLLISGPVGYGHSKFRIRLTFEIFYVDHDDCDEDKSDD
jgi:hypothetical protein